MAQQIFDALNPKAEETPKPTKPASGFWERLKITGKGKVLVGGQDDVVTKFGKCCNPIRGERIVGFVTRGRGITVHAGDCQYVQELDQDRLVDVAWDRAGDSGREVSLKVTSMDLPGLLTSMSQVFSSLGVNICQAICRTTNHKAENLFQVQIQNLSQLKSIVRALQRIDGVEKVERVKG